MCAACATSACTVCSLSGSTAAAAVSTVHACPVPRWRNTSTAMMSATSDSTALTTSAVATFSRPTTVGGLSRDSASTGSASSTSEARSSGACRDPQPDPSAKRRRRPRRAPAPCSRHAPAARAVAALAAAGSRSVECAMLDAARGTAFRGAHPHLLRCRLHRRGPLSSISTDGFAVGARALDAPGTDRPLAMPAGLSGIRRPRLARSSAPAEQARGHVLCPAPAAGALGWRVRRLRAQRPSPRSPASASGRRRGRCGTVSARAEQRDTLEDAEDKMVRSNHDAQRLVDLARLDSSAHEPLRGRLPAAGRRIDAASVARVPPSGSRPSGSSHAGARPGRGIGSVEHEKPDHGQKFRVSISLIATGLEAPGAVQVLYSQGCGWILELRAQAGAPVSGAGQLAQVHAVEPAQLAAHRSAPGCGSLARA